MNVESAATAFLRWVFVTVFFTFCGEGFNGIRFELVLVFLDLGEDAFRDKKETKTHDNI